MLICSAADVSIVPETCTTNVIVQARSVVRHFFEEEKLKGFEESVDEAQDMNVGLDFESGCEGCVPEISGLNGRSRFSSTACELRLVEDVEVDVGEAMATDDKPRRRRS